MIFRQSWDLTKPIYLTMLSWWRFLRRSISACHSIRSAIRLVSNAAHLVVAEAGGKVGGGGLERRREILTSIMRNSLFGRSASLICLTATASPVPQLKAL